MLVAISPRSMHLQSVTTMDTRVDPVIVLGKPAYVDTSQPKYSFTLTWATGSNSCPPPALALLGLVQHFVNGVESL